MKHVVLTSFTLLALAMSARADDVELVTGETLHGTIVERSDTQVVLEHPVLGRLVIPAAQVKAGTAPAAAAPAPAPAPAPPAPPSPWKFRAEFGASGSSGNTDQSDLHAAIGALFENEERRFKASAGWATAKNEGDKTKDQQYVEATHDWLFKDSPWSVFATGRMDWDDFQDWDRRASLGAGVGYLAVDEKDLKLRLRAGLAETREWGTADPDDEDWRLEGLLGAELNWQVNESNAIEAKTTWYPDLQDGGEFRIVSSAAWSVKVAKDSGLSLKLGIEHEYDSHREDPFDTTDFRWFAALLWEF